ncbi:MAG: penicillin-binding transpeptidase domain-containing protein [Oscillospiraceae bacterium]|nr:penicillin-binding transpeptidase domain-containing protein [Oscillospiraceae bacterium]
MQKMYTPLRIGAIFVILAIMLTVFVSALYVIQIHDPIELGENQAPRRLVTRRTTIPSARGNIYDRNGVLLASGTPSYNVKVDWRALTSSADPNGTLLALVYAAMDEGIPYLDTFPVTRGAPFEFVANMTATQRSRLDTYLDFHNLDPDINVSDFLAWMRNHYRIDYTIGILDARIIMGVRYELEIRAIIGTISPYIFAEDVSTDFISYLQERSLVGVFSERTFIREYHTTSAPHLIGYVGLMTAEEFERFGPLGYPMDAIVGKTGAERAFEEELHGRAGEKITRMTPDGTVVGIEVIREPEPGNHITLTMDLDLQIAAENALQTHIDQLNRERIAEHLLSGDEDQELEDILIPGGAVVVLDVNTGELLAAASYPTFNLITLAEDWSELVNDPATPMLNRATQGRYAPGSTFKMATALAGMRHVEWYNRHVPIYCTGEFDRHRDAGEDGFFIRCAIFSIAGIGHGSLDIVGALEVSCNYYFIQIAHWLSAEGPRAGAYLIAEAAAELGLGVPTGLEIPENAGLLATPSALEAATGNTRWFAADTLLAGFGQGHNRFTPVQLANYAATIANGGTLHSLSFVRTIRSPIFFDVIYSHEPEVLNVIEETHFIEAIQEGMVAASRGRGGTARTLFGPDADINYIVASKTGTVQIEGRAFNDGAFVAYAPARNPEIAIAVVIEKGGSGASVMPVARTIFDHYFSTESAFFATPYGEIIP